MKILHIIPMYFPAFKYGGPSVSIHALNKSLVKKGVEVSVMTTIAGLENMNSIKKNKWVDLDGVKIKYFPYYFKDNYTFSPQMLCAVLNEAKNYDVIHVTLFWNFPTLAASLGSLIAKKPLMISPGGALYPEVIYARSNNIKRLYYHFIARHYVSLASAIHYNSQDECNNIAKFLKINKPSFIIPVGIDLDDFKDLPTKGLFKKKYPILKNKKCILFLGRIHKKKGIDLLVEAFSKLLLEYNDLFLVIAGADNDGYKNEIQDLLRSKSLLDKTLFTGILTGRDKISAYVDSEVFVLSSYSENFAAAVTEAMAAGTPVVISNKVGICKDIKENNAGIIVDLNTQSLYQGIKSLLDNPALAENCLKNAKVFVKERYDINKVSDMMIKVYEDILTSHIKPLAL